MNISIDKLINCWINVDPNVFELQGFSYNFNTLLKTFKTKGNLAYEYNPLRNFRSKYDLYQSDSLGNLIGSDGGIISTIIGGVILTKNNIADYIKSTYPDKNSDEVTDELQSFTNVSSPVVVLQRAQTLIDFENNLLNFNLKNPIEIECQPSYDGSVNLILNDNLNYPRLINTRFTVLGNDTYEIVDRKGNNDTNIYNSDEFENDISLYKRITTIPKIEFLGLEFGGNFLVGNYVFYFKYSDADGNETDFIEESGIVSCHIGSMNSPNSLRSGISNENSNKIIKFNITNIDKNYDYLKVYYVRSYSDETGTELTSASIIDRKFPIKGESIKLILTGFDNSTLTTIDVINQQFIIANSVKTQCQCQNILFLGNIYKPSVDYKELEDLSLRVYPKAHFNEELGKLNYDYDDLTGKYGYYNTSNIYNKLGYWDKEMYRFGIVYILPDYTLSSVFNIRGRNNLKIKIGTAQENYITDNFYTTSVYDNEGVRNYLEINQENDLILNSTFNLDNAKGVSRFIFDDTLSSTTLSEMPTIGIEFCFPLDVINELKKHTLGYFIVRQKRIPTILAQAYTMGWDATSKLPTLKGKIAGLANSKYFVEAFLNDGGLLTHDFKSRLISIDTKLVESSQSLTAICPEFELKTPYFNSLFVGENFPISEDIIQTNSIDGSIMSEYTNERHFYPEGYKYVFNKQKIIKKVKITGIEDNIKLKTSGTSKFSSRAGEASDISKFSYIGPLMTTSSGTTNLARGSYGPYIGLENYKEIGKIINIHIPGYTLDSISAYFNIRYEDNSPYYAISPRDYYKNLKSIPGDTSNKSTGKLYRGDCFIGNYTHRICRNFQDPETPINDNIIQSETWKDNIDFLDPTSYTKINRADVNAVQMGHWVTIQYRANVNISMRNTDASRIAESGLVGNSRGFYPLHSLSTTSENKIPESFILNGGFGSTTSDKFHFITPDVPYLKNQFNMRILYSDIHVNDAFKNGFRVFSLGNYRDYPNLYGGLVKLVEFNNTIIAVFEHGVARIVVRERTQVADGTGGPVFLNSNNILPENLLMINTNFGSSWGDSIIITPNAVLGIDTVAKKIWQTDGRTFSLISDFKFQKFLNDNITLTERENESFIGVRNVKGMYNAFKKDVLFTFYDDLYGIEEKVWNLCYNLDSNSFVTFYSWVPSFLMNINNIPFSFDRNTSKLISKLSVSKKGSTTADGIVLSTNVIEQNDTFKIIGVLDLVNRDFNFPKSNFTLLKTYTLNKDVWNNYLNFEIKIIDNVPTLCYKRGLGEELLTDGALYLKLKNINNSSTILLNISCDISYTIKNTEDPNNAYYINNFNDYYTINYGKLTNTVAIICKENLENLQTDFWKHGQAGIFDIADDIKPTNWYGKQHPFEFEFIVNDKPASHKIFDNLRILSNKAEPESFHYEVVGEVYDFAGDKKTMYFRQEATKELLQNLGSNILFNRNYKRITPFKNIKSNLFSLYYKKIDTIDNIYDSYVTATSNNKDYANLTGSEIVYDPSLNEFKVCTHVKGQSLPKFGRLRGNMHYKEDMWEVEIKPINFVTKNETWGTPPLNGNGKLIIPVPPIVLNTVPDDITTYTLDGVSLPTNKYVSKSTTFFQYLPKTVKSNGKVINIGDLSVDLESWSQRRETRLRDKYIRIKIRYSGEDLAIINSVLTSYTISYS